MTTPKASTNVGQCGSPPFRVAVIHGGPGGPGGVAAMARELARDVGVLEPLQTAGSVAGQVAELRAVLLARAQTPVVLIGHSWGAWLAWLAAARYPELVEGLVLVSSGVFDDRYVAQLRDTRLARMSPEERIEFWELLRGLGSPTAEKDALMTRLGQPAGKTDNFDVIELPSDAEDRLPPNGDIYASVWPEAAELRRSGDLLALAANIRCPVLAIHGADDPSPALGVKELLERALSDFRFALLSSCGHEPWRERRAEAEFYALLRREIETTNG